MRKAIIFITVAALALVFALAASCDYTRGNLEGTVTNLDNEPQSGIILRVYLSGSPAALEKTGDDGHYHFDNIMTGIWTVEFYNRSGVLIGSEQVKVEEGDTATLDFVIGANPPPEHTTILVNPPV